MQFTASSGALGGHTFPIIDADGTAGYQPNHDYVVALAHSAGLSALGTDNLIWQKTG